MTGILALKNKLVPGAPPPPDPDSSGISQQLRGRDYEQQFHDQSIADAYANHDPLALATATQGPLADPKWTGFFQSLRDAGQGRPIKLAQDVERPHGIADLAPWNQTDDARLASTNIGSPSMNALRSRARPMPESHESFMAGLEKRYPKPKGAM